MCSFAKKPIDDYIIRESRHPEKKELIAFLQRNYYRHEPLLALYLTKHLESITVEEQKALCEYLRWRHEIMIENLPCIVAIHRETLQIVAVLVLQPIDNPLISPTKNLVSEFLRNLPMISRPTNELFGCVLFPAVERINVFEKCPNTKKALELKLICVDLEHRGKGLATALMREAVDWAKYCKIDIAFGLLTSGFAQRAAENNGFKRLEDMDILSFRNHEGSLVYDGMSSYIISFMAVKLL